MLALLCDPGQVCARRPRHCRARAPRSCHCPCAVVVVVLLLTFCCCCAGGGQVRTGGRAGVRVLSLPSAAPPSHRQPPQYSPHSIRSAPVTRHSIQGCRWDLKTKGHRHHTMTLLSQLRRSLYIEFLLRIWNHHTASGSCTRVHLCCWTSFSGAFPCQVVCWPAIGPW